MYHRYEVYICLQQTSKLWYIFTCTLFLKLYKLNFKFNLYIFVYNNLQVYFYILHTVNFEGYFCSNRKIRGKRPFVAVQTNAFKTIQSCILDRSLYLQQHWWRQVVLSELFASHKTPSMKSTCTSHHFREAYHHLHSGDISASEEKPN